MSNYILNRRREFFNLVLFSTGKFVSIFFTAIYTFAIGLHVLKITGSGLSFATTLVLGIVPRVIIYPFAGVMADRIDKKIIVVSMDIFNGILFISLYFFSSLYGLTLPMIYASTLIMTVFTCFFDISFEAAKPNIVTGKMLMNINSVSRIIDSLSSILGSMIGGMIYAIMDIRFFIIVNGISFIFSGISEMFIDFSLNSVNEEENNDIGKISFFSDIRDGFIYMINDKNMVSLFRIFIALNFFIGLSVSVPLPYIINNILKLSSSDFGLIEGAFPSGMIIGAIIVKKVSEKISYSKVLRVTSLLVAICMVLIGVPTIFFQIEFSNMNYLIYYCIVIGVLGVSISFIDIPIAYIMQKSISEEYRGRVMSIALSIVKIISPVALIVSGYMINFIQPYIITTLGGILLIIFINSKKIDKSEDLY